MNDVTDHANILKEIGSELSRIGKLADSGAQFDVSFSSDLDKGDISTNIALKHFKQMGYGSPMDAAEKIAKQYSQDNDPCIEKVEAVKPGFINFWLSKHYLQSNLSQVIKEKDTYGKSKINKGKKVVVEFSSPNIAKPFTIGHLRSTIIGNAISNLLSATGWEVYKDNHLGDWGTQFGKQIYAIKEWGDLEKIEQSENPVKELVSLYVKFHEEAEKNPELEDAARVWFKKLEEGDPEAKKLWQKCVDLSWKEFEKLYGMLDITFTENNGRGFGESYFEDKMEPIIAELKSKDFLKEDKGAQLVYFPEDKYPPLMVLKQDGASLYSTRDLATDKFRLDYYKDPNLTIINEVGAEQSLYFNQLYALEKMLGWVKDGQRIHVRHGLYRFKDMKMSTRKGNTIWLEDVLQEAIDKAKKFGNENLTHETAEKIGIGALKWNDLKRDPASDIVFEWNDILNMNGNSGPYMQYAYARTQNVLNKSKEQGAETQVTIQDVNREELVILRMLTHYPEIVLQASEMLSTSILCTYLYELAQKFNVFYEKHKVIGSENEQFRLVLTQAVGQVLKNGLALLGIFAPQKI